jgi:SAM-dependent methyltransferase
MFSKSAALYDRIYLDSKDYESEAEEICTLIKREHPNAKSILDVACGTGEHIRILHGTYGFDAHGVDLDEELLSLARKKVPSARFSCANMENFDLKERYDVVMCLFSSIGYVKTLDGVKRTLERFKAHLATDGLILVEPWFAPGQLSPGKIFLNTNETHELTVVRMAYTEVDGTTSRTRFEYLIGSNGNINHQVEIHELGLFTKEEMLSSFKAAGLLAAYDDVGPSGRGLYIAREG